MEIKFSNVSLVKNNRYLIKNFNITVNSNYITAIYNDNEFLKEIFFDKSNYSGEITINDRLLSDYDKNKICYISCNNIFLTKKVSDEFYLVKKDLIDNNYIKKVISSLKMVGLNEDYLDYEINNLSQSEKILLSVALSFIKNPDIIIINNIFKDLDNKNYLLIKKIIIELKKKYSKVIMIIDNINNLFDLCNYFIIFKDNNLLISNKKNIVFKDIDFLKDNNIILPDIINFIDVSKKYNKNISYCNEVDDLIKDVYKNV